MYIPIWYKIHIDFMCNLTVYLDSKAMNYPRSQLSKHLHNFLMTYGYCSSGITTYKYNDIIKICFNNFESLFCRGNIAFSGVQTLLSG